MRVCAPHPPPSTLNMSLWSSTPHPQHESVVHPHPPPPKSVRPPLSKYLVTPPPPTWICGAPPAPMWVWAPTLLGTHTAHAHTSLSNRHKITEVLRRINSDSQQLLSLPRGNFTGLTLCPCPLHAETYPLAGPLKGSLNLSPHHVVWHLVITWTMQSNKWTFQQDQQFPKFTHETVSKYLGVLHPPRKRRW